MSKEVSVLFVDPALASLGWAVVSGNAHSFKMIDFGVVVTPAGMSLGDRLSIVRQDVLELLGLHKPTIVGYEKPFFSGKNTNAAIVQNAIGVMLSAMADAGYPSPAELKPSQIKLAIAGSGNAEKVEVRAAVLELFELTHQKGTKDDAYDAAAGAAAVMQNYFLFEAAK